MGYRIDSYKQHKENQEEFQKTQARQHNGQARGDLRAPNTQDPRYNYNTYKEDYFSGSQAKVYMGDIYVDDIVTIQYNTSQSKQPIYGYSSQNFDAVAMGTVIGNGTLTIAFKEVGYLNVIQSVLEQQRLGVNKAAKNIVNRINNAQEDNISANINSTSQLKGRLNPNMTPSLIRREETIENVLDNLKGLNVSPFNNNYTNISGNIFTNNQEQLDFEDVAEIFEDSIWGDSNGVPFGTMRNKIRRADEFDYFYNRFQAQGIRSAKSDDDYGNVTNLMLTFGDINDFRAEHTLIVLNDVHFTSQGLISAPNGEPIGETYSFFFRDINKSVSRSTWGTMNPLKFHIGTDSPIDLARLKDVEKIGEMIDSHGAEVNIKILSGWDGTTWIPIGRSFNASAELGKMFYIGALGASQSLNKYVEEAVQANYLKNPKTGRPLKVAVEVSLETLTGERNQSFNYILDQHGEDTSVYRVTSPTRDDFYSLNLVRREDFFSPVPIINDAPSVVQDTTNQEVEDAFVPTKDIEGLPYKESDLMKETYKQQAFNKDLSSLGFEPTEKDIDKQIQELQSEIYKIEDAPKYPESNYSEPTRQEDKTIIPPKDLTGKLNYKSWGENPEGDYYIGVSDDFLEHEKGIESNVHKSQGVDTVFYNTKEQKPTPGQQLPFDSRVIQRDTTSAILSTPYRFGEEKSEVALYLYHYDISKQYNQGDVIPERKFFGDFQKTEQYQEEHAHWQVRVKNTSTGKYEQLNVPEMAYLYDIIFGSDYNIYSNNPD